MHDCCDYKHFLHERLTALLPCLGPGEHHATWTRVSHTVLREQWYLWEMRKGRKGKSHQHTVTTGEVIETEQKGEEKQGCQEQQGPQLPGQQSFGEGGTNGEWLQGHPRNPSSKGPYQLLLAASKGWINNKACAWGKRASVRQQAAFYWAFWFSGTNYTTRANDPKTSFTKLGFHSMMEGDALHCLAKQILLPRPVRKQEPNETTNSCDRASQGTSGKCRQILKCEELNSQSCTWQCLGLLPKAALKGFFQDQQTRENWNPVSVLHSTH